jgi:hypothetical protein
MTLLCRPAQLACQSARLGQQQASVLVSQLAFSDKWTVMITCTLLKNTHFTKSFTCRRRPTRTPIACLYPLLPTQNVSRKSKQTSFRTTAATQRNATSLIQKEIINSQKPSVTKDAMFDRNWPHTASSWSQSLASPKNSVSNKLFSGTLYYSTLKFF